MHVQRRPDESPMGVAEALRRIALFRDLDERAIAAIAAMARLHAYRPSEILPAAECTGSAFYCVARGRLRLYRLSAAGRQVAIATVPEGGFFRFIATDPAGRPRSLAEADEGGALVLRLDARRLDALVCTHPAVAARALEHMGQLLAEAYDRIEDLSLYGLETRVAHALARLAMKRADRVVPLTRQELAWKVGGTRERVSERLRDLRRRGLVEDAPHVRGIRVPDPDRLLDEG